MEQDFLNIQYICVCLCVSVTVCVHLCMTLTALCDVADADVNDDRYVRLCELLLAQCVSSTPCCRLDGCTPAGKIQLPLALYVQSSDKKHVGRGEQRMRDNKRQQVKKICSMCFTIGQNVIELRFILTKKEQVILHITEMALKCRYVLKQKH